MYPQRSVSQKRMGYGEITFHTLMIIFTCGLWLPKVMSKRRQNRTVTRHY
ncbi:hypothetical protein [Streptomyces sp. NPDC050738]